MTKTEYPLRSDSAVLNVRKFNANDLEKSLETLKEKNEHNFL